MLGAVLDHRAVALIQRGEMVLNAGNRCHRACLLELGDVDVADADMPDQALLPQLCQRLDRGHDTNRRVGPVQLVELDDVDPDAARITEIIDAIPGAWERTQEGLAQAARGEGTRLDELG
jgi:hypothetical protein